MTLLNDRRIRIIIVIVVTISALTLQFFSPEQPFAKAYYNYKNDTVAMKYVYHEFGSDSFSYPLTFDKLNDSSFIRQHYVKGDIYFQMIKNGKFNKKKKQVLHIYSAGNVALIKWVYDRGARMESFELNYVLTSDLHDSLPLDNQ